MPLHQTDSLADDFSASSLSNVNVGLWETIHSSVSLQGLRGTEWKGLFWVFASCTTASFSGDWGAQRVGSEPNRTNCGWVEPPG
jgi:hypothetical protein